MYLSDFYMMMFWIVAALLLVQLIRNRMSKSTTSASATSSTSTAKPQAVSKNQMAEDMKATKTSQVSDAVSILDDLGSTSSTYRHYCELVGTSMGSSNLIAPYSKRPVAYYDIKCYRLDATYNGGQTETLVAHERSFDPFFFTDGSCDTPVYVDLESFGDNVILVNSTNHVEGPNSDFAQAFKRSATSTSSNGTAGAYAMVAREVGRAHNLLAGAAHALRQALAPHHGLQPAYALAGGGSMGADEATHLGSNVMFAGHGGAPGGKRGPSGQPGRNVNVHVGNGHVSVHYGGPNHMPGHMGDFLGGSGPWVMGGGYTVPHQTVTSADVILGMGLGALLNSMTTTQQVTTTTGSTDTFRGYRLVENVVPLGSPIYCIGEIYRNGTDVYMGRSLAKDYPTSYFATKPEAEVLSAIGSR